MKLIYIAPVMIAFAGCAGAPPENARATVASVDCRVTPDPNGAIDSRSCRTSSEWKMFRLEQRVRQDKDLHFSKRNSRPFN